MHRIFLTCGDQVFLETLRKSFQEEGDLEICVAHNEGLEGIFEAIDLFPDLVILGMELPPIDGLEIAEALSNYVCQMSKLLLVAELHGMEAEKRALSHGIDAVFERDDDLRSLVLNARAVSAVLENLSPAAN